jgi:hypothetical protein
MNDPALKYRGQVCGEHAVAMQSIGLARLLLGEHRASFDRFLQTRRDMDSIGIVVDPTLYRDMLASKSLAQQIRMVEAATAFLAVVDAVAAEVGPRA